VLSVPLGTIVRVWRFIIVKDVTTSAVVGADFLRTVPAWGIAEGRFNCDSITVLQRAASQTAAGDSCKELVVAFSDRVEALEHRGEMQTATAGDMQVTTVACSTVLRSRFHMIMPSRCENKSAARELLFEGRNLPDGVLLSKTLMHQSFMGGSG